jgi:hypothetical protein
MTSDKLSTAWDNIRARKARAMNKNEKLFLYHVAKKNAPRCNVTSRRRAKSNGTGRWYKDSRVVEGVLLETVFINKK